MKQKLGINLLQQDSGLSETAKKLRRWSLVILGVYLIGLVGLFLANFGFGYLKQNLLNTNESLGQEISQYKDREGLYLTLKDRLGLTQTFNSQTDAVPQDLIKQIALGLPPGITLNSIQTEDEKKISVLVNAKDSVSLANFISQLRSKDFTYLQLGNVSLSGDGDYLIKLTMK